MGISIILKDLLSITSGATLVAIGVRGSDGSEYWPTVEGGNWIFNGRVVDALKDEDVKAIQHNKVKFISTIECKDDEDLFIRILI